MILCMVSLVWWLIVMQPYNTNFFFLVVNLLIFLFAYYSLAVITKLIIISSCPKFNFIIVIFKNLFKIFFSSGGEVIH